KKVYKSDLHFFAKGIGAAGRLLAQMHSLGMTHGQPHKGQFRVPDGDIARMKIVDFQDIQAVEQLSRDGFAFLVLQDFRNILSSVYRGISGTYRADNFSDDYLVKLQQSGLGIGELTPGQELVSGYLGDALPAGGFSLAQEEEIFDLLSDLWNEYLFAYKFKDAPVGSFLEYIKYKHPVIQAVMTRAYRIYDELQAKQSIVASQGSSVANGATDRAMTVDTWASSEHAQILLEHTNIGDIQMALSPEAFKEGGLTRHDVMALLGVVGRKYYGGNGPAVGPEEKYGVEVVGRSYVVTLPDKDFVYRLKAATYKGGFPRMQVYEGIGHTKYKVWVEGGRIRHGRTEPVVAGAADMRAVVNEEATMRRAFERGFATDRPLGIGQFRNFSFKGREFGFVVMAMQDKKDERLDDGSAIYNKYFKDREWSVYKDRLHFFAKSMGKAGTLLAQLHALGITHGQPHRGQFRVPGGDLDRMKLVDFADARTAESMSRDEFAFYVSEDFRRMLFTNYSGATGSRKFHSYWMDYRLPLMRNRFGRYGLTPGQEVVYGYLADSLPEGGFSRADEKTIFKLIVSRWNDDMFAGEWKDRPVSEFLKEIGRAHPVIEAVIQRAYGIYDTLQSQAAPGAAAVPHRDAAMTQLEEELPGAELKESQLAKAVREGGATVNLSNIKDGMPPVRLQVAFVKPKQRFDLTVFVAGQRTGSIVLHWGDGLLLMDVVFPIGPVGEDNYANYSGKNITNTILNWLAWEAKINNLSIRNASTRTIQLAYMCSKYFGGESARRILTGAAQNRGEGGSIESETTFSELVQKYGFYGHQIWGYVRHSDMTSAVKLEKADGDNKYKVLNTDSYYSGQLHVGDTVEVDQNAAVWLVGQGGELKLTDFRIKYGANYLGLQGPPTPAQVPRDAAQIQPELKTLGAEMKVSALAEAMREGESTVTLANIKPGQPPVTLNVLYDDSRFSFTVFVNRRTIGSFKATMREGVFSTMSMYPIGGHASEYARQNITNTILNWLAWEAKENNWLMRNDGTSNTHLAYMFAKYFGYQSRRLLHVGEPNRGEGGTLDQKVTFKELVQRHGFYGHQIWGYVYKRGVENAKMWLDRVEGANRYKILDMENYRSNQLRIGDIVEVDKYAVVWLLAGDGKLRPTDFQITHGEELLQLQGPPTPVQVPRDAAQKENGPERLSIDIESVRGSEVYQRLHDAEYASLLDNFVGTDSETAVAVGNIFTSSEGWPVNVNLSRQGRIDMFDDQAISFSLITAFGNKVLTLHNKLDKTLQGMPINRGWSLVVSRPESGRWSVILTPRVPEKAMKDPDKYNEDRGRLMALFQAVINKNGGECEVLLDDGKSIVLKSSISAPLRDATQKEADSIKRGGIDLSKDKTNVQVQVGGEGIHFNIDPAMLERLQNAAGLEPVIINIHPLTTSLPVFMGLAESTTAAPGAAALYRTRPATESVMQQVLRMVETFAIRRRISNVLRPTTRRIPV
ncbi:MAG: hypothetical protein HGA80_08650, partial [Candidatus Omnitrophica bacterium]|nr:hypothetical protein [Candidatus Omnitrophota bacterium]